MRTIARMAGWALLALATACAPEPALEPALPAAPSKAGLGIAPDRVAEVAARLAPSLAGLCACDDAGVAEGAELMLCGYPIRIQQTPALHASTNGVRIRIASGMLRFFTSDDELAFVLAHELSHILLGHTDGAFHGLAGTSSEAEADKLAARIVWAAGFDADLAAGFPVKLARQNPGIDWANRGYPLPAERAATIRSAPQTGFGREDRAPLDGGFCPTEEGPGSLRALVLRVPPRD